MTVTIKQVPAENIIIVEYQAPFEPRVDIRQAQAEIARIIEANDQMLVRIDDLTRSGMTWSQFIEGIDEATQGVPGSMTDPRISGVLVGDGELLSMASESMKQEQYGSTETPTFSNLDEALAYARTRKATRS